MNPEIEQDFACPYCWRTNTTSVDISGGISQEFVIDCENCCNPIIIKAEIRNGSILSFEADRENA